MAGREAGETPEGEAAAARELPAVEAPPLSPAAETPAAPVMAAAPATTLASLHRTLKPRQRRQVLLAVSMALAAGFGALIGALASTWSLPTHDVAGLEERQAMQQSIAHLSRQVALLKADLQKANKAAHARIAGLSVRRNAAPAITGSIPQAGKVATVPLPRPAPHIAAAASRPAVVADWRIRDVRGGNVYVQGHGDIYQVAPGAPLPGLGPVQAIQRRDGHWLVVTPRGIIVARRDRGFFE